jgi:hypothetical protein
MIKLIADNMFVVCMCCNPQRGVFGVYQEWTDTVHLSHGICPDCAAKWRAELAAKNARKGNYEKPLRA